ncbi:MAG: tRNA 2-thiouridine(34) synthase MnmA, partial [Phycisphaerae bacterium]|nr:tRNA 2-thiouridine(34) synthase MnmA [Phycisphaerae bacterium]
TRADARSEPSTRADAARLEVVFDEPVEAIAPGQAVVCYRGDELVGGGWIDAAE